MSYTFNIFDVSDNDEIDGQTGTDDIEDENEPELTYLRKSIVSRLKNKPLEEKKVRPCVVTVM